MKVEDEWDRNPDQEDLEDLLFVTYETDKIGLDRLLQVIKDSGFDAEVRDR